MNCMVFGMDGNWLSLGTPSMHMMSGLTRTRHIARGGSTCAV